MYFPDQQQLPPEPFRADQPQPPVPRRSQAVSPVLYLLPVIAGAPLMLRAMAEKQGPDQVPYLVGVVIGWALVSIIVVWIAQAAWRLGGRSRFAGNAVFSILCILWGLGAWSNVARDMSGRMAIAKAEAVFEQESELMRAQAQHELDTQGYATPNVESVNRVADAMQTASEALTGHDAAAARASAAMLREISAMGKAIDDASMRLEAIGGADPQVLTDLAVFAEHERVLDELARANAELIVFIERAPARYRQLLVAEGVPKSIQDACVRQFNREFNAELLQAVREQDMEALAATREMLALLKRHLGHWQADEESMVVFDEQVPLEDMDHFDALALRILVALERMEEAQRELLLRSGN